jgi:hypothetical protein
MDIQEMREKVFKDFRARLILTKNKRITDWLNSHLDPNTKLPITRDAKVKLALKLVYKYIQEADEEDIRCIYSESFE